MHGLSFDVGHHQYITQLFLCISLRLSNFHQTWIKGSIGVGRICVTWLSRSVDSSPSSSDVVRTASGNWNPSSQWCAAISFWRFQSHSNAIRISQCRTSTSRAVVCRWSMRVCWVICLKNKKKKWCAIRGLRIMKTCILSFQKVCTAFFYISITAMVD
jgi:hypothetical protein